MFASVVLIKSVAGVVKLILSVWTVLLLCLCSCSFLKTFLVEDEDEMKKVQLPGLYKGHCDAEENNILMETFAAQTKPKQMSPLWAHMDNVAASFTASFTDSSSCSCSEQTEDKQMSSFGEYKRLYDITGHEYFKSKVAQIKMFAAQTNQTILSSFGP